MSVDAKRFLEHLFRGRPSGSRITISYPVPKEELAAAGENVENLDDDFGWRSKHASTVDEAVEAAVQGDASGLNVYVGLATRADDFGPRRRGTKSELAGLGCVWLDIDVGKVGHASATCPPDDAAVVDILRSLPRDPSLVVDSGGGYHVYWLLDGFYEAARVEALCIAWHDVASCAAAARGWHIDQKYDATTVLRVPDTHNRKPDHPTPRPVALDAPDDPPRYTIADLEAAIAAVGHLPKPRRPPRISKYGALPPSEPIDLQTLREKVAAARDRKLTKAHGLLAAVEVQRADLLARVLEGRPLADSGPLHHARVRLTGLLGYILPTTAPWESVAELLQPLLDATPVAKGTTREATVEKTRKLYRDTVRRRVACEAAAAALRRAVSGATKTPRVSAAEAQGILRRLFRGG